MALQGGSVTAASRSSGPPRPSGGTDKAIITQAAQKYGINPAVLWGLYGTETSFGKNVSTSSAGAVGPFQFEPATARAMGVNPYDFKSAAYGAARYLAQYRARGVGGMLSAYNAGPTGGYQAGYVQSTLNNAKTYGSSGGAPLPSAGVPAGSVQTVVAHAMGLPAGVTTQSGGGVEPNPKAAGLRLLAQQYRGSDPVLADLLESRAGEGKAVGFPPGVVSTAAGTPSTGKEAQALAQAPPSLSKPAKAPVKIDLGQAKKQYGQGRGGAFPIPQAGETSKGLQADLELPHKVAEEQVLARHPAGVVVKHPSGVPLYIPNQRRGAR